MQYQYFFFSQKVIIELTTCKVIAYHYPTYVNTFDSPRWMLSLTYHPWFSSPSYNNSSFQFRWRSFMPHLDMWKPLCNVLLDLKTNIFRNCWQPSNHAYFSDVWHKWPIMSMSAYPGSWNTNEHTFRQHTWCKVPDLSAASISVAFALPPHLRH